MNAVKTQSILTAFSLNNVSSSLKGFWGSIKGFIGNVLAFSKTAFKSVIIGARTVGIALLTNPVFWVGAAIAGIGYLVVSNWSKVKVFFSGFWAGFKEGFKPVFKIFKGFSGIFKPIVDGFKKVFGLFDGLKVKGDELQGIGFVIGKALYFAFMPVVGVFKVVSWVVDKLSGVDFSPLENGLKTAFAPVFVVKSIIDWIFNKLSSIDFSGVVAGVKNAFGGVLKFVFDIFKVLGNAIENVFLAPVKLIEGVINKIKGFFKVLKDNLVGKVLSFGENLVGGVFSKTSQVFKSVFHRESSKEKEVLSENSKEVVKESSKEKFEKVSKSGVSINNLIGSFNLTINANSKDVVKTIEDNKDNLKEQILQIVREVLDDEGRQLILSMGR